MFSAARIQAIRKSKGLSQEVLAEQSGVSLRTIQRVEQGETVPRGHTILALATALQVPMEALHTEPAPVVTPAASPTETLTEAPSAPAVSAPEGDSSAALATSATTLWQPAMEGLSSTPMLRADPEFLQLLNLSALSFLVLPLLNVVVPFVLWRRRRHTIAHAAEVGRRVLGFQVLWQVVSYFAYGLLAVGQVVAVQLHRAPLKGGFLVVLGLSYLLNVLTVAYYAHRLRQGHLDIYPVRL